MSRYGLLAVLLLIVGASISAQLNPANIDLTCVKNDSVVFTIQSSNNPLFVNSPQNHLATEVFNLGNGVYQYTYIAGQGFVGLDEFTIKYYNPSNTPGNWSPSYSHVRILVEESSLDVNDDFVDVLTLPMSINPLSNDSSSAGDIEVIKIGNTKNCQVSMPNGTTIVVDAIDDDTKLAYVQYVVQDEMDHSTSGMIIIRSDNYINRTNISYVIHQDEQIKIILANDSYTHDASSLGSINDNGQGVYTFSPSSLGSEIIEFENSNSDIITIDIEVIDSDISAGFAKDDLFFTTEQEIVYFDVFENDVEDNFYIVDYSPELIYDTLGMFSYQPQAWESGYKNFYYTVYNGFEHQTANVQIKIDNYKPYSTEPYDFTTFKNASYYIDYRVPVTEYTMSLKSSPTHGNVVIHGFNPTINNDCGEYNGNYVVEYTPTTNYYGLDYFELEYCAMESNKCSIVKINMNVAQDENACDCIAADCVWPGDTNNDGKVAADDLLALGYCLGQSGTSREVSSNEWRGSQVADWNESLMEENVNAKYVDANGDGVISNDDMTEILNHMGAQHGLISTDAKPLSKLGLSLSTDQDTVYTGEWLFLDVSIGSDDIHLEDVQGLSYTLNFPPSLIDSSTFFMDYHDDSWFVEGSPTLEITQQPQEGKIISAFTRTSRLSITGDGVIGTLGFIVEDDLLGIRLQEGVTNFKFNVGADNIKIMGLDGNEMALLPSDIELVLNISSKNPATDKDLVIYPNPANEFVQIYSNMTSDLQKIELYSIEGKLVQQHNNLIGKSYELNIADLQTGFYIVRAYSTNYDRVSQKLQIVR